MERKLYDIVLGGVILLVCIAWCVNIYVVHTGKDRWLERASNSNQETSIIRHYATP